MTSKKKIPSIVCENIVTEKGVCSGELVVEQDGTLGEIILDEQRSNAPQAGQTYLLPGLIDLHTDHLERHFFPRAGLLWDPRSAVLAYDAQIVSAGITTVFDSIAISGFKNGVNRTEAAKPMIEHLGRARAADALRSDHQFHLRCELTDDQIVELATPYIESGNVRLLSLTEHTPGTRSFADPKVWMEQHRAASGLSEEELRTLQQQQLSASASQVGVHRATLTGFCRERGIVMASHDDSSASHVSEAHALGVAISEFPTTPEAAKAAKEAGIFVVMGAPNLIRGRSHVGNMSAAECAALDALDVLASDYVPVSLLDAAFKLARDVPGYDLPRAVATVTAAPASAVALNDRGEIATGKRADLVEVMLDAQGLPVVSRVWSRGQRVH